MPRVDYPVTGGAVGVAIGNLDLDSHPDLAIAQASSGTVAILHGRSDGTFGSELDCPTAGSPEALAVADLSNEGRSDVAVGCASGNVSVLLGDPEGSFGPRSDYPGPANNFPNSIRAADLDQDGAVDLVIGGANSTVLVFPGYGDGTFAPALGFGVGADASSVAIGDLNHDGWLDLISADAGSGTVTVLINQMGLLGAPEPGRAPSLAFVESFPNPAASTDPTIRFGVTRAGGVTLRIYDLAGRLVRTLFQGAGLPGSQSVRWDRRSEAGRPVPPGVYLCELRGAGQRITRRMVILGG